MLHKINTLAIVAGFLFALTSMSIDSFGQNAIVEIKDLVQDAHEAVWTDGNENSIDFGQTAGFYGAVLRGSKLGGPNGSFYSRTGELLVDETISSDTIDIDFAPTLGRNASVVKGFYTIQLPVKKRIQLEMVYDLFLDAEGMRNPGELYVEVYEQNALNSDQWLKTGEMHQKESMKVPLGLERVNQIRESRFVTHHFVANLTYWAGREVQVALVAAIPSHAVSKQRARWCSARLMGCSFDWKFDVVPKEFRQNQSSVRSQKVSKHNRASIKVVSYVSSSTEEINLTHISNPEACPSTEYIGGRWLGYFHGLLDTDTGLTNKRRRGTTAFDLGVHDQYTGPNMHIWDIDETSLENSVLRGTSAVSAATASSGTPFFLIKPVEATEGGDNSDWRIGYTGMTTTVEEDDRVHGFIHTEDWYQDGVNLNEDPDNEDGNRDYCYVRIGYARSSVGNGTDFTWMYDSSVGSPTPAIECFQPEWAYTWDRASYGAAMPSIIKNTTGDYYYMFYTRFLDITPATSYVLELGFTGQPDYQNKIVETIGGFWDQICMARAPVNDVKSSNYSSRSNPWKKGFKPNNGQGNWEFTNVARVPDGATESASYSYPIIHGNFQYRCSPKVHYDASLDHYMMICKGEEGFYIYVTSDKDDLTSWGDGILLLEQEEDELIHYPSLVGYLGSDKYGINYYTLYYSYDKDTTLGGHVLARRHVWFIN